MHIGIYIIPQTRCGAEGHLTQGKHPEPKSEPEPKRDPDPKSKLEPTQQWTKPNINYNHANQNTTRTTLARG